LKKAVTIFLTLYCKREHCYLTFIKIYIIETSSFDHLRVSRCSNFSLKVVGIFFGLLSSGQKQSEDFARLSMGRTNLLTSA
jgi:hypothetical protein